MIPRVVITPAAADVVAQLKQRFGPLMFHQSGGCCDGSQPMCFEKGDFKTGGSDVCIGEVEDCSFYMAKDQFAYWQYCQLTLDITKGRGSSFSLEIPMGLRFIIHSRIFNEEELPQLTEVIDCGD
ncbi:DUF779 domain-containing protein [Limnovirga soli]|jgi:uncharacterized protein|uniref:DUF779 domain-containing protein n=1 Tax=Limnovirga soli TaxID=2656915 RepID=A0A8J8FAP7_9BACT|nr:DUF779 domain-containing protein [Limnovirga soli]NNV54280.1 DUF779 domain-containing protein [Limnovirga soli]